MELVKFTHPNNMKETQSGRAREKVVTIWLVPVKINGKSPIKLLNTTKVNRQKKNIVPPLRVLGPSSVLISEWRVDSTESRTMFVGLGAIHNIPGINKAGITNLHQLGSTTTEDEGSKLENRLFIIFTYQRGSEKLAFSE